MVRNVKIGRPEGDIGQRLEVVFGDIKKEVEVDLYDVEGNNLGKFSAKPSENGKIEIEGDGLQAEAQQAGLDKIHTK